MGLEAFKPRLPGSLLVLTKTSLIPLVSRYQKYSLTPSDINFCLGVSHGVAIMRHLNFYEILIIHGCKTGAVIYTHAQAHNPHIHVYTHTHKIDIDFSTIWTI